jgi:hypothetical protein
LNGLDFVNSVKKTVIFTDERKKIWSYGKNLKNFFLRTYMKNLLMIIAMLASLSAFAETKTFSGQSELVTDTNVNLVGLTVTGDAAEALYYSIQAEARNDGDGFILKTSPAIECSQSLDSAAKRFSCTYIFKADGSLFK